MKQQEQVSGTGRFARADKLITGDTVWRSEITCARADTIIASSSSGKRRLLWRTCNGNDDDGMLEDSCINWLMGFSFA